MMRFLTITLLVIGAAPVLGEEQAPAAKAAIDPLDCRWTFGNHEPLSMYRRAGNRVTGGVEGNALWLADWSRWFDSEASVRLMQDLGLNILHCRFYKGLGWQYESRDFPNVKRFVENCHKHGVRALAYVQFSTLYYETMLAEIPDLANWVALDENGRKLTWHNLYYRWIPCSNAPEFEAYLQKMIRIALVEGGFDGVMLDNCDMPPCYCPRCAALFRKHLAQEPNPEQRFGIPTVAHVEPPVRRPDYGEVKDPLCQEWIRFRSARLTELYRRLYQCAKNCRPTAIFSGNIQAIRRANMAGRAALNMADLGDCFDIFVSQSGNAPGVVDGCVVNRVRELKLARALNTPILALCDNDAGGASDDEARGDRLALLEDAVFGGIPTDRTVLKPDREMVSPQRVTLHRALLQRFNETVRTGREGLAAPSYAPVQVLYSRESIMFSEQSYRAVLSAEEILLRSHMPYGLLLTAAAKPLNIPADCEALLVCDQRCLADAEVETLVRFAEGGGRLIVTGESGAYDALYRQRRDNPLAKGLAGCRSAVCRGEADDAPIKGSGWTIKVAAPRDGGRRLLADLAAIWSPVIRIQAPAAVLAEVKRSKQAFHVHLVNYAAAPVAPGARIELSVKGFSAWEATFAAPMENRPAAAIAVQTAGPDRQAIELPAFAQYAVVSVRSRAASK